MEDINDFIGKKVILRTSHLKKEYINGRVKVQALRDVNFVVSEGDFLVLHGSSGSGKSTLLNILGCLDVPTSGEYYLDNELVSSKSVNELSSIRNEKVGFIFQSFHLIPVLNVLENIELPIALSNRNYNKVELRNKIQDFCKEIGLENHLKHKPEELSGGQRQRVAIARALITNPKVIFADEPTANLDSKTAIQILEIMIKLNIHNKTTFIFATHDPQVKELASRSVHIIDGVTVEK